MIFEDGDAIAVITEFPPCSTTCSKVDAHDVIMHERDKGKGRENRESSLAWGALVGGVAPSQC